VLGAAPEIRFGVFGASGSGKTVLLSTFFGRQQGPGWMDARGYSLFPESKNYQTLLEHYNRLTKAREFSEGNRNSAEYIFTFKLPDYPRGPLKICWYDYPGGWLTEPPDTTEEKERQKSLLRSLLRSHVGFLLFDGERVKEDSTSYIKHLLDIFRIEVHRQKSIMYNEGLESEGNYPKQWIFALTKADLFQAIPSVDEFIALFKNAQPNLNQNTRDWHTRGGGSTG
jgi:hypothetical protein